MSKANGREAKQSAAKRSIGFCLYCFFFVLGRFQILPPRFFLSVTLSSFLCVCLVTVHSLTHSLIVVVLLKRDWCNLKSLLHLSIQMLLLVTQNLLMRAPPFPPDNPSDPVFDAHITKEKDYQKALPQYAFSFLLHPCSLQMIRVTWNGSHISILSPFQADENVQRSRKTSLSLERSLF